MKYPPVECHWIVSLWQKSMWNTKWHAFRPFSLPVYTCICIYIYISCLGNVAGVICTKATQRINGAQDQFQYIEISFFYCSSCSSSSFLYLICYALYGRIAATTKKRWFSLCFLFYAFSPFHLNFDIFYLPLPYQRKCVCSIIVSGVSDAVARTHFTLTKFRRCISTLFTNNAVADAVDVDVFSEIRFILILLSFLLSKANADKFSTWKK